MPMLDPARIALTNPITLDTFSVSRRAQAVSGSGEAALTPLMISGVRGIVTPDGGKLQRNPDFTMQDKDLVIETRFFLRSSSLDANNQNYQPDIVTWNGNQYIVDEFADWSRWGSGFIVAGCNLYDTQPQPPAITVSLSSTPNVRPATLLNYQIPGTGASFTLPFVPVDPRAVLVIYQGLVQSYGSQYTIIGATLTLNFSVSSGQSLAVFM